MRVRCSPNRHPLPHGAWRPRQTVVSGKARRRPGRAGPCPPAPPTSAPASWSPRASRLPSHARAPARSRAHGQGCVQVASRDLPPTAWTPQAQSPGAGRRGRRAAASGPRRPRATAPPHCVRACRGAAPGCAMPLRSSSRGSGGSSPAAPRVAPSRAWPRTSAGRAALSSSRQYPACRAEFSPGRPHRPACRPPRRSPHRPSASKPAPPRRLRA
mmetsp:Transcript_50329/g.150379  ORF Transcript_50329/g.150379 Transcript_50329/m.150379 type:complete len:214 (-) Transcript_50329:2901-3542(-)